MRARMLVLGLAGMAAVAAGQRAEEPKIKGDGPVAHFGRDHYPPEAIRAGEQGRVATTLKIDVGGWVSDCIIDVSSGSASLDAATCQVAQSKLTFTPAKNAQGRAVPGSYPLAVTWSLDEEDGANDAGSTLVRSAREVTRRVKVGPEGVVVSCVIEPPSVPHPPLSCGGVRVGFKMEPAYTRVGRPVGATVITRFVETVELDP